MKGSCNDVLEFEVEPNEPRVNLQRGPKSYCYGPLVEALEMCTPPRQQRGHESSDAEDESDGLNAFLKGCEEEDGFDDESDGQDFYAGTLGYDELAGDEYVESDVEREAAALRALRDKFRGARSILSKNPLGGIRDKKDGESAEDRYCSILVRSELHTLEFYESICKALLRRIRKEAAECETEFRSIGDIDSRQIENTVDVFLAIRHGSM